MVTCPRCNKSIEPVIDTINSGSSYTIRTYDSEFNQTGRETNICYKCYKKEQNKRNKNDNEFYKKVKARKKELLI